MFPSNCQANLRRTFEKLQKKKKKLKTKSESGTFSSAGLGPINLAMQGGISSEGGRKGYLTHSCNKQSRSRGHEPETKLVVLQRTSKKKKKKQNQLPWPSTIEK